MASKRKPEQKDRTVKVSMVVSARDHVRIRAAAGLAGQTVSQFCSEAVLRSISGLRIVPGSASTEAPAPSDRADSGGSEAAQPSQAESKPSTPAPASRAGQAGPVSRLGPYPGPADRNGAAKA